MVSFNIFNTDPDGKVLGSSFAFVVLKSNNDVITDRLVYSITVDIRNNENDWFISKPYFNCASSVAFNLLCINRAGKWEAHQARFYGGLSHFQCTSGRLQHQGRVKRKHANRCISLFWIRTMKENWIGESIPLPSIFLTLTRTDLSACPISTALHVLLSTWLDQTVLRSSPGRISWRAVTFLMPIRAASSPRPS